MSATAAVASPLSLHDRFKSALTHRYFIRLHMTIVLALVLLSGVLASRLMTAAGSRYMGLRYPIAVMVSYLVFFGLVRIWIAYVSRASRSARRKSGSGGVDLGDVFSGSGGSGESGASGGSGGSGGRFLSGGGRFGGGGSSASFAEEGAPRMAVVPVSSPAPAPKSGGGSKSGFSLDLDGDGVLLLILFAILVIAICGVGAYLIYQGPTILSEAAFHAALVPGLVRTARNSHDPGWMPCVLRATFVPFLIVLALAGLFGYQAHKRCPGAATVRQVFTGCIFD